MVVSIMILLTFTYWRMIPILTNIVQMGWNHPPDSFATSKTFAATSPPGRAASLWHSSRSREAKRVWCCSFASVRSWSRYICCRCRWRGASYKVVLYAPKIDHYIWVFPKIGAPQNGWFIMEHPIKMGMISGYPYFWKHPYHIISLSTTCHR